MRTLTTCGKDGTAVVARAQRPWIKIEDVNSMKSKGKHIGGRAYLVARLMAKCGLSRRQSVALVNVILKRMIFHLRRGHRVGVPSDI